MILGDRAEVDAGELPVIGLGDSLILGIRGSAGAKEFGVPASRLVVMGLGESEAVDNLILGVGWF
jgi:hypothetical protein